MIHPINKQLLEITIGCASKPVGYGTDGNLMVAFRRFDSLHSETEPIRMNAKELNQLKPLFTYEGDYSISSVFMPSQLKRNICINPINRQEMFNTAPSFSVMWSIDWGNINESTTNKMFIWIGIVVMTMVIGMVVWMFI